jgi:Protein of unknown function (DUF3352)
MPAIARSSQIVATITVAALFAAPVYAAAPRDELLHYVPEQVGFCLVLNDLRGHSEALLDSPFLEHFLQTPLGKSLAGTPEIEQLAKLQKDLKALLGADWQQLRDDIFGDAVVFVYRPGPPGKPEQEQGLILVRARDAQLLARTIEQINTKQKESGDLKALQEKQHKGAKYFQRTEKKETNYYYLDGSILLFTAQEELLRQALDQGRTTTKAETPIGRRLRELGADQALLSLWINPRAFDAALAADLTKPNKTEAEKSFTKGFTPYWKALDSVVISVALEKDLKIRAGFQMHLEALPASARVFFQEAAQPSELWRTIPDDAMLALAGRVNVAALFELLGEFMPEASRKNARDDLNRTVAMALGKDDFLKEVLPQIGPDFGMYLSAPPDNQKTWFPRTVLAVRVGADSEKPAFNHSVLSAINAYAFAIVLGHNKLNPKQQMSLKTVLQGKREVKYLISEQGFPLGFQPSVALDAGYIIFASSPEVMRRFGDTFANHGDVKPAEDIPLMRASFKELRRWLTERQDVLTPIMAEQNKLTKDEAQQRMMHFLSSLELIDHLEISQRALPGQAVFTLTLQPAWPLRK